MPEVVADMCRKLFATSLLMPCCVVVRVEKDKRGRCVQTFQSQGDRAAVLALHAPRLAHGLRACAAATHPLVFEHQLRGRAIRRLLRDLKYDLQRVGADRVIDQLVEVRLHGDALHLDAWAMMGG